MAGSGWKLKVPDIPSAISTCSLGPVESSLGFIPGLIFFPPDFRWSLEKLQILQLPLHLCGGHTLIARHLPPLNKLVALVAEQGRAHVKVIFTNFDTVKVIFTNFDTKGYEKNFHLTSAKKTVLILIFCLLPFAIHKFSKFFQYLLMFRKAKVIHLNVLIEPSSKLNLD